MIILLLTAALAAGTDRAHAPTPGILPPPPATPPQVRDLAASDVPPTIFTYQIDPQCRVTRTRKLQGPRNVLWRDAARSRDVFAQRTLWRMVDGQRLQLQERRVRLLGELVRQGELVCHVRPAGDVLTAWIERADTSAARPRAAVRESLAVEDGGIPELGTFSVTLEPVPTVPAPAGPTGGP